MSRDVVCDFQDDCGDFSDETTACSENLEIRKKKSHLEFSQIHVQSFISSTDKTISVDCTFDASWSCGYSPSIDDVTGLADLWDVKSGHFDEGWLIRVLYAPVYFYRLEMRRVYLRVSGTAHGLSKISRRRRSPCDVTNPLHLDSSLHPP